MEPLPSSSVTAPPSFQPPLPLQSPPPARHVGAGLIRLIGVFKLFKGIVLLVAGFAALRLVHGDVGEMAAQWVRDFNFDPENRHIRQLLVFLTGLTPKRLHELGVGAFIYSILFFTEGIGLVMAKRWAEWVAVISTAGFIPLEIYELIRRHTLVRAGLLVVNIAIVIYLVRRIQRDDRIAKIMAGAISPTQTEPAH